MSLTERVSPLCDLLLGAAYADDHFKDREREAVTETLTELSGSGLPAELATRINTFSKASFDLNKTAAAFKNDSVEDRKRVLQLVAAINDSDDEFDFAEDDYLRALGKALDLPADALAGLTLDVEIDELQQDFAKIGKMPPPPPPAVKKAGSVDVDID
ncbi:MAG: TerB family tellurite resistance protein [Kofleriaceae bacterium]